MGDLLELAAKCEAATGPDLTLDEAIRVALGFEKVCLGWGIGMVPTDEDYEAAEFTASLDAAMQLVPEGAAFILSSINPEEEVEDGRIWALVGNPDDKPDASDAATPALALAAAALRARAASTHRDEVLEDLIAKLRAIDEDAMYQAPATTHKTVNEAAAALERACEALTEARELLWHFRQEAPLEGQPPYEKLSSALTKSDEALSLIRVNNG